MDVVLLSRLQFAVAVFFSLYFCAVDTRLDSFACNYGNRLCENR